MESWTYRAGRKILEIIGPVCSNIGINDQDHTLHTAFLLPSLLLACLFSFTKHFFIGIFQVSGQIITTEDPAINKVGVFLVGITTAQCV